MRRCAQLVALALCSSVRSQTPALWVYRKNMSAYLLDDIGRIKLQFPVGSVHTVSIQVEKPQCGEWLIWLHGIVAVRHPRQRSACFCSRILSSGGPWWLSGRFWSMVVVSVQMSSSTLCIS